MNITNIDINQQKVKGNELKSYPFLFYLLYRICYAII